MNDYKELEREYDEFIRTPNLRRPRAYIEAVIAMIDAEIEVITAQIDDPYGRRSIESCQESLEEARREVEARSWG